MSSFSSPTQFEIITIKIDDIEVSGITLSVDLWENIYSPTITGSIVMVDTDGVNFIENNRIEGSEEFEIEFKNANDDNLKFKGLLNGMRNREIAEQKIMYVFDFYSKPLRNNETNFVVRRFKNEFPKDIVTEMINLIEGKIDKFIGDGLPMNFLGNRKRPTDIIKYVLTHGVTSTSKVSEDVRSQEGDISGTSGFLCWETLNGHRFCSVNDLKAGKSGDNGGIYYKKLQNVNLTLEDTMNNIVDYNFNVMGDVQSKLRSGAFNNTNITLDLDAGIYTQFNHKDQSMITDKMKQIAEQSSRVLYRPFSNERFGTTCQPSPNNEFDQSKLFLSQNVVGQNTLDNESGSVTLSPQFHIHAGDTIELRLPKVITTGTSEYDKKHSGRYIVKQIGHHFTLIPDTIGYSKLSIIRSTNQQDDATSTLQ